MGTSSSIIWGALKKKRERRSRTNLNTESGSPSQQNPGLDVAGESPAGLACSSGIFFRNTVVQEKKAVYSDGLAGRVSRSERPSVCKSRG